MGPSLGKSQTLMQAGTSAKDVLGPPTVVNVLTVAERWHIYVCAFINPSSFSHSSD